MDEKEKQSMQSEIEMLKAKYSDLERKYRDASEECSAEKNKNYIMNARIDALEKEVKSSRQIIENLLAALVNTTACLGKVGR